MKKLLFLCSLLLNFAVCAKALPNKAVAMKIYSKFKILQLAAQEYYDKNGHSHTGIGINSYAQPHLISRVFIFQGCAEKIIIVDFIKQAVFQYDEGQPVPSL